MYASGIVAVFNQLLEIYRICLKGKKVFEVLNNGHKKSVMIIFLHIRILYLETKEVAADKKI